MSTPNNDQFSETTIKSISAHASKSELLKTFCRHPGVNFMSYTASLTTPKVPVYHLGQEAQVS